MEQTGTCRVVTVADEWRKSLGLHHRGLSQLLRRSESEWSLLRAGRRQPSEAFVGALLRAAPEPWKSEIGRAYATDLEVRARLLEPVGRKEDHAHVGVQ